MMLMWLFQSMPADAGCTIQRWRPTEQCFLWASSNPDPPGNPCEAAQSPWYATSQSPGVILCLPRTSAWYRPAESLSLSMPAVDGRREKRAPCHRRPSNTGAGTFSQDVAPSSCHDSGRDRCFTSQAGAPNNKVTNELTRLRIVVWAEA